MYTYISNSYLSHIECVCVCVCISIMDILLSVHFYLLLACPVGSYKHVQGNTDCDECPDNSNTTTNGSVSCRCISGYYRAPGESVTLECTG